MNNYLNHSVATRNTRASDALGELRALYTDNLLLVLVARWSIAKPPQKLNIFKRLGD